MTPDIDNWRVDTRPGGWLRLQQPDGERATVYLRYRLSGPPGEERLTLQTIIVKDEDGEGLSGRVWRRVPLSKVERALAPLTATNLPAPQAQAVAEMREAFRPTEETTSLTVEQLDEYFEEGSPVDDLIDRIRSEVPDTPSSPPVLAEPDAASLRPPEGRLTDAFLRKVGDAYKYYASIGNAPARDIAEQANVPVRTVHRWVLKARERGILPPARSGRAG
ncbi:hypothetical protein F0L17_14155 [Streptomyces sp. TRM43335]|uniref:Uncharacterized protein n=1 Tax=Streptomyces taklimakanensis TaxID=2569853 RepID=A0A6G2BDA9_9ACTN|nr:hypothetical protein [Streptomyces taklimakanensis]MTE20230.1 hypothetical protein [Streptomyces taklimakanensis]